MVSVLNDLSTCCIHFDVVETTFFFFLLASVKYSAYRIYDFLFINFIGVLSRGCVVF